MVHAIWLWIANLIRLRQWKLMKTNLKWIALDKRKKCNLQCKLYTAVSQLYWFEYLPQNLFWINISSLQRRSVERREICCYTQSKAMKWLYIFFSISRSQTYLEVNRMAFYANLRIRLLNRTHLVVLNINLKCLQCGKCSRKYSNAGWGVSVIL